MIGKRGDSESRETKCNRDHLTSIVVTEIIARLVEDQLRLWKEKVIARDADLGVDWFILSRQYDLTPKRVHFGAIAHLL